MHSLYKLGSLQNVLSFWERDRVRANVCKSMVVSQPCVLILTFSHNTHMWGVVL
jgi:hypothetical protein